MTILDAYVSGIHFQYSKSTVAEEIYHIVPIIFLN